MLQPLSWGFCKKVSQISLRASVWEKKIREELSTSALTPCLAHIEHGEGMLEGVRQLITGSRVRAEVGCKRAPQRTLMCSLRGAPAFQRRIFPWLLVLSCGWCWPLSVHDWSSWSCSWEAPHSNHQQLGNQAEI